MDMSSSKSIHDPAPNASRAPANEATVAGGVGAEGQTIDLGDQSVGIPHGQHGRARYEVSFEQGAELITPLPYPQKQEANRPHIR